jgi:N-6 DNA Methylase/TaqI-like C-terminal specificity domain
MTSSKATYESTLSKTERRKTGAYYTPVSVAEHIVGEVTRDCSWENTTCMDPACGDGVFLCALLRNFLAHVATGKSQQEIGEHVVRFISKQLFGMDIDPHAVQLARENLLREMESFKFSSIQKAKIQHALQQNICVGNALLEQSEFWPMNGFHILVGNPPYVNVRRLAFNAVLLQEYRKHFQTATGAFDLYVLFFERAHTLLRPGGNFGYLVPNKIATLDYANACRKLLATHLNLKKIIDCSQLKLFPAASVYPYIIIGTKKITYKQPVQIEQGLWNATTLEFSSHLTNSVSQQMFESGDSWSWHEMLYSTALPTIAMRELCEIHSGTTGFMAQQVAQQVCEAQEESRGYPFIVSGNIDRFCLRMENVRFMKRHFQRAILPFNTTLLSSKKQKLFMSKKIVVSGMSQHLEAVWDSYGCALGVQVFAILPIKVDPFYLLGILNSQLMTHVFQSMFAAKRLGGGYYSINKGQLTQLPIYYEKQPSQKVQRQMNTIALLARQLSSENIMCNDRKHCEQQLNETVNQLYRLSIASIQRLNQKLDSDNRKAA